MSIVFENVSYSYAGKAALKTRERAKAESAHQWGGEPDQLWALHEVSFEIADGEMLGIAGHTGSGKSTLLLAMGGLLAPQRGRVIVDGADIYGAKADKARRHQVGLVFQYPEHQLFAPTVLDDVCFGPRNLGLSESDARAHAEAALRRVGLDPNDVGDRSPFQLSGGQQRRVALAGVLAMGPRTLALDEPASGLDPRGRRELLELVKSLNAEGITCVLISHSMADLADCCDRVLLLNAGRRAALGTPQEVFADAATLKALGLALPPAQALALRLREAGYHLPRALYSEPTLLEDLEKELEEASPTQTPPDLLAERR